MSALFIQILSHCFFGSSRDMPKDTAATERKITACSGAILCRMDKTRTASPMANPMQPNIIRGWSIMVILSSESFFAVISVVFLRWFSDLFNLYLISLYDKDV